MSMPIAEDSQSGKGGGSQLCGRAIQRHLVPYEGRFIDRTKKLIQRMQSHGMAVGLDAD